MYHELVGIFFRAQSRNKHLSSQSRQLRWKRSCRYRMNFFQYDCRNKTDQTWAYQQNKMSCFLKTKFVDEFCEVRTKLFALINRESLGVQERRPCFFTALQIRSSPFRVAAVFICFCFFLGCSEPFGVANNLKKNVLCQIKTNKIK